jgi:hypothetical protein
MPRCLLVLDIGLPTFDVRFAEQPLNYFVTRQAQEPYEVYVLSLVDTRGAFLATAESMAIASVGVIRRSRPPGPERDIYAAARERMHRVVKQLAASGCRAEGCISDDDLLTAVGQECDRRDFDEVVVVDNLKVRRRRRLRTGPVHRLRRRLGSRLVVFSVRG